MWEKVDTPPELCSRGLGGITSANRGPHNFQGLEGPWGAKWRPSCTANRLPGTRGAPLEREGGARVVQPPGFQGLEARRRREKVAPELYSQLASRDSRRAAERWCKRMGPSAVDNNPTLRPSANARAKAVPRGLRNAAAAQKSQRRRTKLDPMTTIRGARSQDAQWARIGRRVQYG